MGNVFNFNPYAYANNSPMNFIDPTCMAAQACGAVLNQDGSWDAGGCGGGGGGGAGSGGALSPIIFQSPGQGGGGGGQFGGGGGGIPMEKPMNVTANRPPDIRRQEFFGFGLRDRAFASMFESIYGGWNRFMWLFQNRTLNFSLGVGAAGQVMPDYTDAEVGVAMDTNFTFCFYGSGSAGSGLGGVWGAAGLSAGLGGGQLSSGVQTSCGTYWVGGTGALGEGKVAYTPSGGLAYSRGIFGWSASATGSFLGVGGFVNKTAYECL